MVELVLQLLAVFFTLRLLYHTYRMVWPYWGQYYEVVMHRNKAITSLGLLVIVLAIAVMVSA